jgi:hypothetical protein
MKNQLLNAERFVVIFLVLSVLFLGFSEKQLCYCMLYVWFYGWFYVPKTVVQLCCLIFGQTYVFCRFLNRDVYVENAEY